MWKENARAAEIQALLYTLLIVLGYLFRKSPAFWKSAGTSEPGDPARSSPLRYGRELSGGLYGLLGGILCDTGAFHIFAWPI
jgi:hypothetical protein